MSAVTRQVFCANELLSGTPLKVQYLNGNPFYALVLCCTFENLQIVHVRFNSRQANRDPDEPDGFYPDVDTISITSIINGTVKIETIV